jgi:hypothetical protein
MSRTGRVETPCVKGGTHPFFKDYARFYKKQLQLAIQFHKESEKRRLGDPLTLVQLFYEKLYGKRELTPAILSDKETDLARALLSEYSCHDLEDLITYTLTEASKTGFGIKTFGGIRSFIQPWRATRTRQLTEQKERARILKDEALEERYEAFKEQQIMAYLDALSDAERADLEATIREQIAREPGPAYIRNKASQMQFDDMAFRMRLDDTIARRMDLPSLDAWKRKQSVH